MKILSIVVLSVGLLAALFLNSDRTQMSMNAAVSDRKAAAAIDANGNLRVPERSKNSNALKWREFLPVLGCVTNWLPQASAA